MADSDTNTDDKTRDQQINDLATRVATEFKNIRSSLSNGSKP